MRWSIGRTCAVGLGASLLVLAGAFPASAGHSEWVGDDSSPSPDPSADRFSVSETETSITMRFTPNMDPSHKTMWRTEALTAAGGSDFIATSGTWPGEASTGDQVPAVTVDLVGDDVAEGNEYFGVMLWLDGYPRMGTPPPTDRDSCIRNGFCDYATVEITDDDPVPSPERNASTPATTSPGRSPATAPTAGLAPEHALPASVPAAARESHSASATTTTPLAPGPGFELSGEAARVEDIANRHDGETAGGGNGGGGVSDIALAGSALSAVGLGTWLWRRRRAW